MTLAATLETEGSKPIMRGATCTVRVLLDELSDDDSASLAAALRSDMTSAAISRALRSAGHRIGGGTLQRHRRGLCRCDD